MSRYATCGNRDCTNDAHWADPRPRDEASDGGQTGAMYEHPMGSGNWKPVPGPAGGIEVAGLLDRLEPFLMHRWETAEDGTWKWGCAALGRDGDPFDETRCDCGLKELRAVLRATPSPSPDYQLVDAVVSFVRVFDQQGFDGDRSRVTRALHAVERALTSDGVPEQ